MEKVGLYSLVISKSTLLDQFLLSQNLIPKDKKIDGRLLILFYERQDSSVRIYIVFCGINGYGEPVNVFGISIWQPKLKESLGIDLDKFVQKHPNLGSIEMFSLNYYTGTIEEKIRSCFEFIVRVLSHPELLRVYEGDYYTNEYYKPWYEGNNLD
jgi:hypothetical protein